MTDTSILPVLDAGVTEHIAQLSRGDLYYLAAGPTDGPVIIFVHGWPELALSWQHQLLCFGSLGFRAIAVDMPGHGRSVVHSKYEDYRYEALNRDLIELLEDLGAEKAIWVGHDNGSMSVWSLAAHFPKRCHGVASLCVPYRFVEYGGNEHAIATVDRSIYPESEYPAGQWDYRLFYVENFEKAQHFFEDHTEDFLKFLFRRPDPTAAGLPAELTARVRKRGGWFNDDIVPTTDLDLGVMDEETFAAFVEAYQRTGFFGADAYYMNDVRNIEYARTSVDGGYLDIPVLFLSAAYDFWLDTVRNWKIGAQMRRHCRNLSAVQIESGHWMQQEEPAKVNAALAEWLIDSVKVWPSTSAPSWTPIPDDYED